MKEFTVAKFLMGVVFGVLCGVIFISVVGINKKLGDIRAIESEVRDANWIMACADISKEDYPETYKACHN